MKSAYRVLSCLLLSASMLAAQAPQPGLGPGNAGPFQPPPRHGGAPAAPDPLIDLLFPPELIMQHQQAIGLSPEQRSFMKDEIRRSQVRFTELQWQLQDQMEALVNLVKAERPAEAPVVAQLDKVLNAEREVKRAQFALLIRLKNNLTPDQQAKLRDLRRSR